MFNISFRKIFSGLLIAGTFIAALSFNEERNDKKSGHIKNDIPQDTLFTPNTAAGWGNYASYLLQVEDSVELELILYRTTTDSTNWAIPSETGTIHTGYAPLEAREIDYTDVNRDWRITIRPNAKCFIQLLNGPLPSGNPAVIPIKIKFKK